MASMIKELFEKKVISATDFGIAGFLSRESGSGDPDKRETLELLAALISMQAGTGSSCLTETAYRRFKEELKQFSGELSLSFDPESKFPEWKGFQELSCFNDLYTTDPFREFKPVVFFKDRFYFYKYWLHEKSLAEKLCRLASESSRHAEEFDRFSNIFNELFNTESAEQRAAAELSVKNRMTVITGGPGTGKTTIISKIILTLLSLYPEEKVLLAAPTGKAASRMNESLRKNLPAGSPSESITERAVETAGTLEGCSIHRLLGSGYGKFSFNKNNHLNADLIIIDEASMVDISIMNALLDAIDRKTSLILLGDKDQLASVAVGSVLSDICALKQSVFKNNIAELTKAYRFDPAVREIVELIKAEDSKNLAKRDIFIDTKLSETKQNSSGTKQDIAGIIKENYKFLFNADPPSVILEKLNSFKILSTTNESVARINETAEKVFGIDPARDPWYNGRPVMVTKNNYETGLFNGDCGVILERNGTKRAYFQGHGDHSFAIQELGIVETVYAMTIHKSQGSEFKSVLISIPDDINSSAMLTKEILYTAVTRAKKKVSIYASAETIESTLKSSSNRGSGLKDLISVFGN